jgi:hypothetical protein
MQTNIDIAKTFMETPDGVLSIHQISKKLKLPYGTAYNRIHLLNESGIVQILPQGKAKLCALNPDNAMTSALLALGSSQATETFIGKKNAAGQLLKKIRKALSEASKGTLYAAIILTPDMLESAAEPESVINSGDGYDNSISLDFFYLAATGDFDETSTERVISSLLKPGYDIRVTSMTVDRETMLGMLTESENEAGLAAYSMLHGGLVLLGHENFYNLILEAFARRLSIV